MEELARRLRSRGTEDDRAVALRLDNAREEMRCSAAYRHVVVNDDLEQALSELIAIVGQYRKEA
jgi:guanylate kinase